MAKTVSERNDVLPILGEIFREYGFSGASLAVITARTGLGKGSLYHFFPKGKVEMAEAVLNHIDQWFEENVYIPLRENQDPTAGINVMFQAVNDYFYSGNRVCLVGVFALDNTRDKFSKKINDYFSAWINSLAIALKRNGMSTHEAKIVSEDIVAGIQGALVLARSQNDPKVFTRTLKSLQKRALDR